MQHCEFVCLLVCCCYVVIQYFCIIAIVAVVSNIFLTFFIKTQRERSMKAASQARLQPAGADCVSEEAATENDGKI